MRKVVYAAAVGLGGFVAGPDEAMDWLRFSDEAARTNASSWDGADTMSMSRQTYHFAERSGGIAAVKNSKTLVFSRTVKAVESGSSYRVMRSRL